MAAGSEPPDRWNRIWEVFDRALKVDAAERPAFLAETCGPDAEMLREVEKYLAAYEQGSSPLDRSPALARGLPGGIFPTRASAPEPRVFST